jgi:hypothetical protein
MPDAGKGKLIPLFAHLSPFTSTDRAFYVRVGTSEMRYCTLGDWSEIEFSAPIRLFRSAIAPPTDTPIYASTSTSRC